MSGRLDTAVNSAGCKGQPGPLTELTTGNDAATFDSNVNGVVLSADHERRLMQPRGQNARPRVIAPAADSRRKNSKQRFAAWPTERPYAHG